MVNASLNASALRTGGKNGLHKFFRDFRWNGSIGIIEDSFLKQDRFFVAFEVCDTMSALAEMVLKCGSLALGQLSSQIVTAQLGCARLSRLWFSDRQQVNHVRPIATTRD